MAPIFTSFSRSVVSDPCSTALGRASLAERLDEVHRLGRKYQQAEAQLKRAWEQWNDLAETLEG